jgi:hypothetical protein
MLRAVYEGFAAGLCAGLASLAGDTDLVDDRTTGGGSRSETWCEVVADLWRTQSRYRRRESRAPAVGRRVAVSRRASTPTWRRQSPLAPTGKPSSDRPGGRRRPPWPIRSRTVHVSVSSRRGTVGVDRPSVWAL